MKEKVNYNVCDGSQAFRLKSDPFSPPNSSLRKCLKGFCWELETTDFEGSPSKGPGPETAVHHFLSRSSRPRRTGQDTLHATSKQPCPCSLPSIHPFTSVHPRKLIVIQLKHSRIRISESRRQ